MAFATIVFELLLLLSVILAASAEEPPKLTVVFEAQNDGRNSNKLKWKITKTGPSPPATLASASHIRFRNNQSSREITISSVGSEYAFMIKPQAGTTMNTRAMPVDYKLVLKASDGTETIEASGSWVRGSVTETFGIATPEPTSSPTSTPSSSPTTAPPTAPPTAGSCLASNITLINEDSAVIEEYWWHGPGCGGLSPNECQGCGTQGELYDINFLSGSSYCFAETYFDDGSTVALCRWYGPHCVYTVCEQDCGVMMECFDHWDWL